MNTSKLPVSAKVLLVDDDWRQLELRASILSIAGFSVLTAERAADALALAARFKEIDVAVVDYEMPGMNGAQLAENLKVQLPQLNVVLYSGATSIPSRDVQKVDTLIPKSEGVTALLRHLLSLPAEFTNRKSCSGVASPLHERREHAPCWHKTEDDLGYLH